MPPVPQTVAQVNKPYRTIISKTIPVMESIPLLKKLETFESRSMHSQPPVVWDKALGFQIHDPYGNKWLDFSSGVLVTNAGHGVPAIRDAISDMAQKNLLHAYLFPTQIRAEAAEALIDLTPEKLDKVFFLSTGSEAIENIIKISRTYGHNISPKKIGILSFEGAFHGRTMGAQMAGGIPTLKNWIINHDPDMHTVSFPNCYKCPLKKDSFQDCDSQCFQLIEQTLEKQGKNPGDIAAVITESYQGSGALFAPTGYMRRLYDWCKTHDILLVFDEVQAAFGRTGKWFAYEHYGIIPNLVALGKGISSSLPVSAVVGEAALMDIFDPGHMTSTHSANPICLAAVLANIKHLQKENLVENAYKVGLHMEKKLQTLKESYPDVIGHIEGRGLMFGLYITKDRDTKTADRIKAEAIVTGCVQQGLLMCNPVGPDLAMIKLAPPLCITIDAVNDGIDVIHSVIKNLA